MSHNSRDTLGGKNQAESPPSETGPLSSTSFPLKGNSYDIWRKEENKEKQKLETLRCFHHNCNSPHTQQRELNPHATASMPSKTKKKPRTSVCHVRVTDWNRVLKR